MIALIDKRIESLASSIVHVDAELDSMYVGPKKLDFSIDESQSNKSSDTLSTPAASTGNNYDAIDENNYSV